MPIYEYHCRRCGTTFDQRRPMSESTAGATCPAGHKGAGRVVSLFAARVQDGNGAETSSPGGGCGGCAGSACACGS
jgi:putative FmdB family regulatory protein